MLAWLQANPMIIAIGALVIYAMLPAGSPIKLMIQKILAQIGIMPNPNPTPPGPGPTPGPTPTVDIMALIMQILTGVLLKSKADGNKALEDSTAQVMAAIQDEQVKMARSPLYSATR